MAQKYKILNDEAIAKLCSLIRESHSISEAINDTNLATNSTFSSVHIQQIMDALSEEDRKYAEDLVGNLKRLVTEVVDTVPTVDTAKTNTLYLYKASDDTGSSYEQYMLINDAIVTLGTTEVNLEDYYNKIDADDKFVTKVDLSGVTNVIGDTTTLTTDEKVIVDAINEIDNIVDDILDGTTTVPKAEDALTLDGHSASDFVLSDELPTSIGSDTASCEATLGYTCKNLIPSPYGTNANTNRGITFTPNTDGTISYTGIANDPTAAFYTFPTIMHLPAGSYKLTGGDDIYGGAGILLYDDKACTVTYTGQYEGLLTISTTSVYIYNTLDGTVNWNKDTNPYGYEKEFTIKQPAYVKIQARSTNNTYTEEVNGLIYPMVRLASIEDDTWEIYKPNVDTRLTAVEDNVSNMLGGMQFMMARLPLPTEANTEMRFTLPLSNGISLCSVVAVSYMNSSNGAWYSFGSTLDGYSIYTNGYIIRYSATTAEALTKYTDLRVLVAYSYEQPYNQ